MSANTNHSSLNDDNSALDAVIREVKEGLKNIFFRRKDLITKLGEAFKHTVSDEESICEEIKNELHDEIAQGLISRRDIERHCPDEWKKKTKPKKEEKDKSSFSQKVQEAIPQLLVDTDGNALVEPATIPSSDSNYNDVINNEESQNIRSKCTEEFHAGNALEDTGKSTDCQVKEPESNLEAEVHDDQSK